MDHALYQIRASNFGSSRPSFEIELFSGHPVFAGHFPGCPLLPGTMMLEMVRRSAEVHFSARLQLNCLRSVKFIHPVSDRQGENILNLLLASCVREGAAVIVDADLMLGNNMVCRVTRAEFNIEA